MLLKKMLTIIKRKSFYKRDGSQLAGGAGTDSAAVAMIEAAIDQQSSFSKERIPEFKLSDKRRSPGTSFSNGHTTHLSQNNNNMSTP